MSSYIVERSPDKYGGQQKRYLTEVEALVTETAATFHKAVAQRANLTELFHKTLISLSAIRQSIAKAHGTADAELFGIRRDGAIFPGPCALTSLRSPYEQYHKRLLPYIQKHLSTMRHTLKEFQETVLKIPGEPCLGRASSIEFSILTFEAMKTWPVSQSEVYANICKLCSLPIPEGPFELEQLNQLIKNKTAMQRLKERYPEDYKRLKISQIILHARTAFEGKKSDWVLVTIRSEVNGKMYALSQYHTWLYRDFKEDPIEHMTGRSVVSLIHQDPFLIEGMLVDIAAIFKQAIEWDRGSLKTLQNHVALFQYELAHAMPLIRGSAAVSEWFEMAIYRFHGFNLTYHPKKMVNLEALTLLPKPFVDSYEGMLELDAIVSNPKSTPSLCLESSSSASSSSSSGETRASVPEGKEKAVLKKALS